MDYPSPGSVRSPFSPRVRPSITGRRPIGLSSAKKNQNKFMQSAELQGGDVIYKTPMTTIETFGTPLPVMVTEALTFASGEVTVRMSSCGWCWAVAGRRVLAWGRDAAHPAKELALPQTDLAHKADLVVLFYEDGQMPACVGVSPEGVVRYWPSVGQEGAYTDVTCELAGQECERLILKPNGGLLLATTTCTLVRIDTCKEGRPTVTCQTLRPPSGWLGGIGRRVSLLFFGSMPAHGDTKLVGVVVLPGTVPVESEDEDDGECVALVATGPLLQLWRGADLHEHHLRRPLSEAFARAHLAQGDLNSLEIMALDVHANGPNGLLLLVAAVNIARSPEMRYALAHVSVEQAERPRVTALVALRAPREDAALRCLPLGARAALYSTTYVAIVSATAASDKAEYIDVSAEGDRIVGAALCDGCPLLFSRKHGVLLLTINEPSGHAPSLCDSPMGSPCPSDMYDGNLSLYEIDPHEVSAITTDICGKLKTAFLFHVRRSPNAAAILAEAFPERPERDVDAPLDRAVLAVATEMLDDVPAGDPRWKVGGGAATRVALGSSTALQVSAQLRDKQRAFSLFLDFLRAHMLWRRLGLVSREGGEGCARTAHALGALAERLAAARALQRAHLSSAQLVDAALHQVATGMGPDGEDEEEPEIVEALSSGALSPADVCFRRVSRISRVLRAVATLPVPTGDPRAAAAHAAQALSLLNSVVAEMHKCRAQWAQWAQPAPSPPPPELGPRALLPALAHLHKRAVPCVAQCSHNSPDISLRAQVLEAAATLADLILTEAAPLQHSPHTAHIYERMRRDIIQPYIDEGQTERAAVLAEKFKDFELLIEMCVNKNDMDRLYSYIDKYANEGVAEKAFAWLASRGGAKCALLLRSLGVREPARLAAWLAAAPDRRALLALHQLAAGRVAAAAPLLLDMATEEAHSVARMTTMASMAKLCLLASDEPEVEGSETWRRIEGRLALAEQHRALPRDLRTRHGLLAEDMRVLDPEDLLHMYIESESKALNEYDFKKALDLTDFIQDMERRDDLRLRVWCACIRRDDWSQCRVDSPSTELQDKMFFRLMDLVHLMGGDLELLLPPVEDILTARELADLVSDPRFHFIIKYGYECMDAQGHQVDA